MSARRALLAGALALIPAALVAQSNLELRVLYAGDPETGRTKGWLEFLSDRTAGVRFADRKKLVATDFAGMDAVVFDGDIVAFVRERRPDNPPEFPDADLFAGMPTVLVGGVGSALGNRLRLKASSFFG